MRKYKFAIFFFLSSLLLLIINLIIIVVFSNIDVRSTFYNALNVSSLAIAFVSFIASSFFSFSVYLQTKNQNKINESLPKKDDQYIIANYSLFDIENEISFFSIKGDEKSHCLTTGAYLEPKNHSAKDAVTRLVFLPTNSVNMPTYKVLVRSVDFVSSSDEVIYSARNDKSVDGLYSSNILNRGYNCFCVDILGDIKTLEKAFAKAKCVQLNLDIISVFNVKMTASFFVYLNARKSTDDNPDKKLIPDLSTYTIHHSNYRIEDKSIASVS